MLPVAALAWAATGCTKGTDDASKDLVTAYSTGRPATSSDLCAALCFTCRLAAPAHEVVLGAELERADENEAGHPGIRDEQIALANAAAAHVAAEPGCAGTGLVSGCRRRHGPEAVYVPNTGIAPIRPPRATKTRLPALASW
ncbi:hypothetical protein O1L60_14270 [Streptomyces diastatochromogenes]|nr:hypothetical protein [Streptomyces diastatochromogenes]